MIKVLVLGLDGATWDLIKPWVEEEKLQTFRKLMENGVWGNLESTIPPITLPAWVSMVTGKNPGKIGYAYLFVRDRDSYNFKFVRPRLEPLNPLWKLLKLEANKISFILKIPTILRDDYMDLYLKGEFVFENVLVTEREKELLERIKSNNSPPSKHNKDYILWHAEQTKKELELIEYLIENDQQYVWDFLISVIYCTDHLNHLFWRFVDKNHPNYTQNKDIEKAMMEYYIILDSKLNKIIKKCEKNNIIIFIVSDHGHGPLIKRVNLNKWLIENGYLKLLGSTLKNQNRRVLKSLINRIRTWKIIHKLYKRAPVWVKKYIHGKLKPQLDVKTENINWKLTKAYFSGYNGININLKGREPSGTVNKEDYEDLISEIIRKLKTLKDPETGKPIIKNVWRKFELYSGDLIDNLPDVIIEYNGESKYESALGFEEQYLINKPLFYTVKISSAHKRNGIFIVYGPGIRKGQRIDVKIYDIAPTILHIFGVPIPNDVDGRVLMEIFEKNSEFAKRNSKYVDPSYYEKRQDDEKLKKVIKSLKGKI